MNNFPSKEIVEQLRQKFPKGTRVELIQMNDPFTKLTAGDQGTVTMVDSIGTVFVKWDCGSGLGLAFGEDSYKKVETISTTCYGTTKTWTDRKQAASYFLEAMMSTEGAEQARYAAIYGQLITGKNECSDTD